MTRRNVKDLLHQQFGRLSIEGLGGWYVSPKNRRERLIRWRCQCGATGESLYPAIKNGKKRSCGCLYRDVAKKMGLKNRRHGESNAARRPASSEYMTWISMIQRCVNPKHKFWHRYGGRGITVCDRWRSSFENFLADVGRRPSPELSIDRIDNDGNYEPGNVKWSTQAEQISNQFRGPRKKEPHLCP